MINQIAFNEIYFYNYENESCYLYFLNKDSQNYYYNVIKCDSEEIDNQSDGIHNRRINVVMDWLPNLRPITNEERLKLL